MRADQKKFGKSAWAAAVDRMERLQYAVSKETLQLMRAKEICLEERKHGLKEEVSCGTVYQPGVGGGGSASEKKHPRTHICRKNPFVMSRRGPDASMMLETVEENVITFVFS